MFDYTPENATGYTSTCTTGAFYYSRLQMADYTSAYVATLTYLTPYNPTPNLPNIPPSSLVTWLYSLYKQAPFLCAVGCGTSLPKNCKAPVKLSVWRWFKRNVLLRSCAWLRTKRVTFPKRKDQHWYKPGNSLLTIPAIRSLRNRAKG